VVVIIIIVKDLGTCKSKTISHCLIVWQTRYFQLNCFFLLLVSIVIFTVLFFLNFAAFSVRREYARHIIDKCRPTGNHFLYIYRWCECLAYSRLIKHYLFTYLLTYRGYKTRNQLHHSTISQLTANWYPLMTQRCSMQTYQAPVSQSAVLILIGRLTYSYWFSVLLTLWRPLLPYGYSYKASCARLG